MPAATLAFLGQTDAVEALARPIPGRRWPHPLAALTVRNYRLYLSAQVISTTGLWMQRIAQDWLVLELSGSVAAVGIAVALQFLPVLIFGLVGGVLADRYPKRDPADDHPDDGRNPGGRAGTPRADRHGTGLARLPDRHAARFRHGGGQSHPPGVRRRTGRRPARSQRGQPQLLGVPVRRAGRSRALRSADPRRRPGLVVPDQRRLLPRRGDHAGDHPAPTRNRDGAGARSGPAAGRPALPPEGLGDLLDDRPRRHDGRPRSQHAGHPGGVRELGVRHWGAVATACSTP